MELILVTKLKLERLREYVKKRLENDTAHDFEHVMRVFKNAMMIARKSNLDISIFLVN